MFRDPGRQVRQIVTDFFIPGMLCFYIVFKSVD